MKFLGFKYYSAKTRMVLRQYGVLILFKMSFVKFRFLFNDFFLNNSYKRWIKYNEENLEHYYDVLKNKPSNIKISLVVPVYRPSLRIIQSTIRSVLDQYYLNWELCLAVSETDDAVKEWLSSIESSKIKIVYLETNKGIAGNTNEAIRISTGHYVGFLDHDDLLPKHSLLEFAHEIDLTNSDFLYSDEDLITEDGKKRFEPHFKPDFSPELLTSMNYVTHLMVVRREIGCRLGWLRSQCDGSQDHDFALRCFAEKNLKVKHIPKVLYHWRVTRTSTLSKTGQKSYAHSAGILAVKDYFAIKGENNLKVEDGFTEFSYKYQNSAVQDLVSIIIPSKDQVQLLKNCINSIQNKSTYPFFEIVIIENNSTEKDTFSYYEKLKLEGAGKIKIVTKEMSRFNYSELNNFGVMFSEGKYLIFLNNDTEIISPDWIERLLDHASRKEIGAVGAKLFYQDNTIQHAGIIVGIGEVAGHSHKYFRGTDFGYKNRLKIVQNVSAVTGACLMMRKEVFNELNGFDECFAVAYNDVDLCLSSILKGYRNVWTPYAELYHYESKSRGIDDSLEKLSLHSKEVKLFKEKWRSFLEKSDPCYNPNLTHLREDFSIDDKT